MELFSKGFALRGPQNPQDKVAVTYVPNLIHEPAVPGPYAVTLVENPNLISGQGTTGLRTWEASLALSEFILQSHGSLLDGVKTVLELGAGTGLCSLICAKLGVPNVRATDGDENVVASLKVNAEANGVGEQVTTDVLWWGSEDAPVRNDVDLLIGADVVRGPSPSSLGVLSIGLTNNSDRPTTQMPSHTWWMKSGAVASKIPR